jgi:3-phosphoshikimate 1-carboxyvinyltransferase
VTELLVAPATRPLLGVVPVPGDKSITHRALMLAALADGSSKIRSLRMGVDNRTTAAVLRALGVRIEAESDDTVVVHGVGLSGLSAPAEPLDCGNSGTTMRLLAGILAAQPFRSVLTGDASLRGRPMARIATPLRARGARIEGAMGKRPGEITAPLEIGPLPPPNVLSETTFLSPIASAQVKSALLLSGLFSEGKTTFQEPTVSRDHTERMLDALGAPILRSGSVVMLEGGAFSGHLRSFELDVPGDLSAAAFVLAAGVLVPGSDVGVRGVGLNPTRTGFLDMARLFGATLHAASESLELGETVGSTRAVFGPISGTTIAGELVARGIDEIPIAIAMAARARGKTVFADAAELRVKESDRLLAMVDVLRAFGVACEETPDGVVVEGVPDRPLRAAVVDSKGDHRIAMSAAVLALLADGPSRIRDADNVATSFPRFAGTLRALGADVSAQ